MWSRDQAIASDALRTLPALTLECLNLDHSAKPSTFDMEMRRQVIIRINCHLAVGEAVDRRHYSTGRDGKLGNGCLSRKAAGTNVWRTTGRFRITMGRVSDHRHNAGRT
jgi:hypothetical protein